MSLPMQNEPHMMNKMMDISQNQSYLNTSTIMSSVHAAESSNGIQFHCNMTTMQCYYDNPNNLTDFLVPQEQCLHGDLPFHLICHGTNTTYTEAVYGYVSPFLVVFTIITNILMSVVLVKKNMRTPTNILLMAMALSDMFTGIWPIPCFIKFYTLDNYKDFVPYNWCFVHEVMTEYMPTIFHTASIWLTVSLAVQRYIYVCHSLKAKQWCTISNAIKVIVIIYIVAILTQCSRFFEQEYMHVTVQSITNPNAKIDACLTELSPFVLWIGVPVYFNLYYWIRVIFIHLVPCTSLIVLNAMLIAAMRNAQARKELLLRQNRRSECRRLKESNCTTLMLVAVVGLFLLVEFPLAVLFILQIIGNTFDVVLMSNSKKNLASMFINLIILLSYPLNFFIYCGMSRQFRETFKRLFTHGTTPADRTGQSQYISLASENGGTKQNTGMCVTKDTVM